jgi:cytochrome c
VEQIESRRRTLRASWPLATLVGLAIWPGCGVQTKSIAQVQIAGGNASQGKQDLQKYGCGTCHEIAGVPTARGKVGPPLTGIANRRVIAGYLANEPDNMTHWIQHPQQVAPGNDMPEMGVTEDDARDIAAYLYSLK